MFTYDSIWNGPAFTFETSAEERAAILAAKEGDEQATLSLLVAYRPLMKAVIAEFTPVQEPRKNFTEADWDDYRQAAIMGILSAIRAWNPDIHSSLAGIARQHVLDAVENEGGAAVSSVTVPERTMKRFLAIAKKAEYDLATGMELAPKYEMRPSTFRAIWDGVWADAVSTLAAADDEEGPRTYATGAVGAVVREYDADNIPALSIWGADRNEFVDAEDHILVRMAFDAVDETETEICRMAYGFGEYYDPLPDAEIAHRIGLSRQKTQRTRTKALAKMRDAIGA